MNQEIESLFKSLKEVKSAISLISKELDRVEVNLKNITKDSKECLTIEAGSDLKEKKDKAKNTVVHRVDNVDENPSFNKVVEPPKYDIKVVGLGVQKIKE